MGLKFLQDIVNLDNIQFVNSSGANAGLINMDGNDFVLSNPLGDILLGDGASDVYIGDGTNNVDILFEQSGSIKADDSSSSVVLTLGSNNTTLAFGGNAGFGDDIKATFGNSDDLQIYHDGTNSVINNTTGDLQIYNNANDKDIVFLSDDGSGGTTEYFRVDGDSATNIFSKDVLLTDNISLKIGSAADLKLYHDGSHSYIKDSGTGNLRVDATNFYVRNSGGTKIAIDALDGAEVALRYNGSRKLETTNTGVEVTGEMSASGAVSSDLFSGYTYPNNSFLDFDKDDTAVVNYTALASVGRIAYLADTNANEPVANAAHEFFTGTSDIDTATSLMVIETGGNVGIGTSNPAKKLHISDSSRVDIKFTKVGSEDHYIRKDGDYLRFRGHDDSAVLFELRNNTAGSNAASFPSGNLGVGTSSPTYKLDVAGGGIRATRSTAGWAGWFENTGDSSGVVVTAGLDSGDAPLLIRKQDGTELFSVRGNGTSWFNNGNVGINTTSPTEKLHVEGRIRLGSTPVICSHDNVGIDIDQNNNSGSNYFRVTMNGETTELFRVQENGNVGIGTTSPSSILETSSNGSLVTITQSSSGNTFNGIRFKAYTGGINGGLIWNQATGEVRLNAASSYFPTFYSSGSEAMRISTAGNVGIGDSTPTRKLTVNGDIGVADSGKLFLWDSHDANYLQYYRWELNSSLTAYINNAGSGGVALKTAGNTRLHIDNSGKVGIGTTSPSGKLHVSSDSSYSSDLNILSISGTKTGGTAVTNVKGINVDIGSNDHASGHDITNLYGAYINNNTSGGSATVINNWYGIYVPAVDADRVSNSVSAYFGDNVGIGTTSPGEKLDVAGDIKLSGDIELGHASDTTIARASAGKVTIEGQPIQTKQMSMTHHNFFMNSTSTTADFFIPYNNLNESSNPTNSIYYGRMVAPYDGRIVKVVLHSTAAIGTACQVLFWVATSAGVFAPSAAETVTGVNLNTANTSATATFSTTSTAEFNEGDVLGVSIIKSSSATANMQVTVVWEYTV